MDIGTNPNSLNFQRRYESLLNYSNDPILTVNLEGKILQANERGICLFGKSIIGEKIQSLFVEIESHVDILKSSQIIQSVSVNYNREGLKQPFIITLVPILNKENISEIMVIIKDLREVEYYREEMECLKVKLKDLEDEKKITGSASNLRVQSLSLKSGLNKLEIANQKLEEMNDNLTRELELAGVLQKSLLPVNTPDHEFLNFAFHYEPMGHVGGDYYDVVDLGSGKLGVMLADVSGHGVSSAFIAAMLKVSFVNYAPKCKSPSELLDKLNRDYCTVIQTGEYVTAFYTIFDPQKGEMIYSGAGHPEPLFFQSGLNRVQFLSSKGFFLGMFEEAEYADNTLPFNPGDRYLVYTDGIIEAYSEKRGEQFGDKRLLRSFKKYLQQSMASLIYSIIEDVKGFMHKSKFYDDLTIVSVEYKN